LFSDSQPSRACFAKGFIRTAGKLRAARFAKKAPVFKREFFCRSEGANRINEQWALDSKPTPAAMKLEFELDQRDLGLKEPPRPDQIYDFSLLEELGKR
jgi:hypothetical protein